MRQKAVDLESAQTSGKARAVKAKAAKPVNVDKAAH